MAESSDALGGRYRLEAPLGAGGMATVHRAHDILLGRQVAIKFLAANIAASPEYLERFGREARAMAAITHPNLIAIYDVGWADEQAGLTPFLVMELVPGGTLAERLSTEGPLQPPEVATLVEGLASALDTLHRAGIVHRDVKPQNVLLAPTGPKLADLGVARLDDPLDPAAAALTVSGTTPGTLRYLAPEVILGQVAGPKADAYALATVAFEALTGRLPRPAETLGDLVQGAQQPPLPVSVAMPALGVAFDAAFAAALDRDPSPRLDPLSFVAALWEALNGWVSEPRAAPVDARAFPGSPGPSTVASLEAAPASNVTDAAAFVPSVLSSAPIVAVPAAVEQAELSGAASLNPLAILLGNATTAIRRVGTVGATAHQRSSDADGSFADPLARVVPAVVIVALAMGVIVLVVLIGRPGLGSALATPTASNSGVVASGGPTTSPSFTPTPSPAPTDAGGAARAALETVSGAIEAARGGRNGLKGGDVNDLVALVDEVRQALDDAEYGAARAAAAELSERAEKASKDLDEDRREALLDAIDSLRGAIPAA